MDETEKEFLNDLGLEKDAKEQMFEVQSPEIQTPEATEPTPEEIEQKAKNRRERRLLEKLQSEREANIDLNTRLQDNFGSPETSSEHRRSGFFESNKTDLW